MSGKKRPPMNFHEMGIPDGAILKSKKTGDEVRVIGPRTIEFRGEETSLTDVTLTILDAKPTPSIAQQWLYKNKCLRWIYNRTYLRTR